MLNFSITKSKKPWGNFSFIKKIFKKNLHFRKFLILLVIIFSSLLVLSQTKELDTPELPPNIVDTVYIDLTATGSSNIGTYENPVNNWPGTKLSAFYTSSGNMFSNLHDFAILFKSGVTHDLNPRVRFRGRDMYIGSYGQGDKPILQASSGRTLEVNPGDFNNLIPGDFVIIKNLELRGAIQDTTYLSTVLLVNPESHGGGILFNEINYFIEDIDITYGYRGAGIHRAANVYIDNIYVTNVWHDGIYMTRHDSIFVTNSLIEKYNREWVYSQFHQTGDGGDEPGGDGIQTGQVHYFYMENSVIDGSRYGGKFNFIAGDTGNYLYHFDRVLFIAHPYKSHFHGGASNILVTNSVLLGPGSGGQNWNSHFYNTLFIGVDKEISFTFPVGATPRAGYGARSLSSTNDFYNCVFVNLHDAIMTPVSNPNVRNSIFYNINNAFIGLFGRQVDGSGNIHFNEDESIQNNLSFYSTEGAYQIINPQFVNPTISFTLHTDDNRTNMDGQYPHHWYEWHDWGDWRLQEGSPAINAGDSQIYDSNAEFLSNAWGSNEGFMRKFNANYDGLIDHEFVLTDILGTPRPHGEGYDIGAYEYTGESGYTLTFQIENQSGTTINNASITFNGSTRPAGVYTLHGIEEGTYDFSVAAPGYETYVYNGLVVEEDMEIPVIMTAVPTYNISFDVKDNNNNPVTNAVVTLGEITNPQGNYTFNDVPGGAYNYSVTAAGYQTVSVTGYEVNADATIEVVMSPNTYNITLNASPSQGGTVSGQGTYTDGQTVNVTASPNEGYSFVNWTENGNVVSTQEEYEFTATQNRELTANFSIHTYTVSLTANPSGAGELSGAGTYDHDTDVTLNAEANEGYTFVNWTEDGNVVSNQSEYSFTVTGNRNLTAHFIQETYSLTLTPNPTAGGITTGAGSNFTYGQEVTAEALANPGFQFSAWSENGIELPYGEKYTFNITADRHLTANFSPREYLIQVTIVPEDGGHVIGAGTYYYGEHATLEALPEQDFVFFKWLFDDQTESDRNYSFFVEGDREFTAQFVHIDDLVRIDAGVWPEGFAFIEGSGDYPVEQMVVLTATPADNDFSFVGWMEDGRYIGHENPYIFTASNDRNITAGFTYQPGELEVRAHLSIPETGHIYGAGNYSRGSIAMLQAELESHVSFQGWRNPAGQIVSRQNPYTFEVNRSMELVAIVELKSGSPMDEEFRLTVYPNPSDGIFTVNIREEALMTVHNSQGVALESIRVTPENNQLNLGYLPSGVYFLRFQTHDDVMSAKIIIR